MDHKSLKRSRQELNTPRRPLISTSKSPSVVKLAAAFRRDKKKTKNEMAPKLLTNSRVVVKKLWWKSENESCCKLFVFCFLFLGLFLPHFHLKQPVLTRYCLSGTIETAPNREDPLLALRSENFSKVGGGG